MQNFWRGLFIWLRAKFFRLNEREVRQRLVKLKTAQVE